MHMPVYAKRGHFATTGDLTVSSVEVSLCHHPKRTMTAAEQVSWHQGWGKPTEAEWCYAAC